ncbi:protein XRI1 [Daucus carota subsp. sativus]|uniref:protein XRI1 n=1 Tax=Daucus carota subsp. sativus TaxID=79200 RepID=UPI0007EF7A9B|nr:PREDICTED: protein XRI1-like [Daucus carota subsp. sativus]
MWEWHDDEFVLDEVTNLDVPQSLWNDLVPNEENLSCVFDEITPVKACGDVDCPNTNNGEMSESRKETADNTQDREKCKSNSSHVKRRRMLQFDSEAIPILDCNEDMPPAFLKEKDRADTLEEAFSNMSQWVSGEDTSSSGYEGLDQSSEVWVANCLTNAEIQLSSNDLNSSGAAEVQNAGLSDIHREHETRRAQKCRPRPRKNVVLKGKKSYTQTPVKGTSSVAYPFGFIKPCGVHGDVTLRDINQRICTPPKPKPKEEDPAAIYPTSAFSGKPVVGQTKIHTEGGKGCITIMRTKG